MDAERVAGLLAGAPPEAVVFFVATTPVFELRGAIPLAIGAYGMTPAEAYVLGVLGNLVPVVALLLLLEPVSVFLRRHSDLMDGFFDWLFERTRYRVEASYRRYGALALVPFVAVPLPVTGAWTGCAAAFVFGVPNRLAFPAITLGVMISGVLVTSAATGAFHLI
ncbi:MAG: COG2426 family protein [Halobacteriales archaeon]